MAYRAFKVDSAKRPPLNFAVKSYVCDTPDDIKNLPRFNVKGNQVLDDGDDNNFHNEPCDYGSSATVGTPFSGYTLFPNNEWIQIF